MTIKLNKSQKEAIDHIDGPLLIIAGAGSGKTKVLVERIANIILSKKANPGEIVAVTFTNKAAKELKTRIIQRVGDIGKMILAGTFHLICASILRKYAERLGYTSNFVIYDSDDTYKVVKSTIKAMSLDATSFPYKKIANIISKMKNKLVYPEDYNPESDLNFHYKIKDIYQGYQDELHKSNAFDFDDLICFCIKLFQSNEDLLFEYQNKMKYICVDEYQDTNFVQDLLVKMLGAIYQNICVVGDEDQSIYSWRGADINNILDFKKKFKECKVIQLEENYRSTTNILNVANAVISENTQRLGKKLFTNADVGDKAVIISSDSDIEESIKMIDIITKLVKKGTKFEDICILYRTNSQSRSPEENLRKNGLPYVIVGGTKFYERKEIKDIIAYLKLLLNPKDNVAFERIVNFPPRGIGKTTLEKVRHHAFQNDMTNFDAMKDKDNIPNLPEHSKRKIKRFLEFYDKSMNHLAEMDAEELCEHVLVESNLKEYYKLEAIKNDSDKKIDNLYEFLASISEFAANEEKNSLRDFLESVSLLADIDSYNESDNNISLMTVHSAKGLEFENVIIIGMNDGLFPIVRDDTADKIEEERRLFYVAVTRAKKKLYLSTYKYRKRSYGDFNGYIPSRFLKKLPKESVDMKDYEYIDRSNLDYERKSKYEKTYKTYPIDQFNERDLVVSKQFGEGIILMIEGEGKKQVLTVDFDEYGIKKLLTKYAGLKPIDN
ncbi:MAG: UvrD-helicase domain-containing protein [Candidatus Delongbacteria bacterium]|jgi:DNA helicase-2/ATP-dependent DNA helicase PcrA|nr:UvrD-helicase domain-containing protein [Candidatus Delongbacteria bacterium]